MLTTIEIKNKLVGVWDLSEAPLGVGGLLIWISEILSKKEKEGLVDLVFVGKLAGLKSEGEISELSKDYVKSNALLELASSFDWIDCLYSAPTFDVLKESLRPTQRTWPNLDDTDYEHGCYIYLQDLSDQGLFNTISLSEGLLVEAKAYIDRVSDGKIPVTVHLKNNPKQSGCSNADVEQWQLFFECCNEDFPVVFILVGQDKVNSSIKNLPNVIVTHDTNETLALELAIIQSSSFFMGMTTGPCNIALLSGVPCVLFKNPDHHVELIKRELDSRDRYTFCSMKQVVLRKFEHKDLLMEHFEILYTAALKSFNKEHK